MKLPQEFVFLIGEGNWKERKKERKKDRESSVKIVRTTTEHRARKQIK
jgi:hypothetical protein